MKFIAGQFKAINSRLVRSRFASASVMSSLQNEPGSMAVSATARSGLPGGEGRRRATRCPFVTQRGRAEAFDTLYQPKEIESKSKASAGIFGQRMKNTDARCSSSSTVEIRRLQDLEGDSRMQGRVFANY